MTGPAAKSPGAEKAAAALRARVVRLMDRDGDGKVSAEEQQAGVEVIAGRMDQFPGLKRRFDRDDDGKLDESERNALAGGLQTLLQNGHPARRDQAASPTSPSINRPAIRQFSPSGKGLPAGDAARAEKRAEMERKAAKKRSQPSAAANGAPEKLSAETAARIDRLLDETEPAASKR